MNAAELKTLADSIVAWSNALNEKVKKAHADLDIESFTRRCAELRQQVLIGATTKLSEADRARVEREVLARRN